jgi:hypothetical protein
MITDCHTSGGGEGERERENDGAAVGGGYARNRGMNKQGTAVGMDR